MLGSSPTFLNIDVKDKSKIKNIIKEYVIRFYKNSARKSFALAKGWMAKEYD